MANNNQHSKVTGQKHKCPHCGEFTYGKDKDANNPITTGLWVSFFILAISSVFGLIYIGVPIVIILMVLSFIKKGQIRNDPKIRCICDNCNYEGIEIFK